MCHGSYVASCSVISVVGGWLVLQASLLARLKLAHCAHNSQSACWQVQVMSILSNKSYLPKKSEIKDGQQEQALGKMKRNHVGPIDDVVFFCFVHCSLPGGIAE